MKKIYLVVAICSVFLLKSSAQISLTLFSSGFSAPVDIKNCGDHRLFIVEQRGRIYICDTTGAVNALPFLNIQSRVKLGSEQGLLGLAFPADFLSSGYFYVNYTSNPNGATTISRFHVSAATPDSADPNSEEILLTIYQPYSNHNGGHVAFGPDGYLYIGMGDGGSGGDPQNRAQNPDSLLGKMLRIEVDPSYPGYHIPDSNPFASDTTLGRGEIWALGLRNPWRFSFDSATDEMWIGDVGQGAVEEIDLEPAHSAGGYNYGWRCYEGNSPYTVTGCQPQSYYTAPVFSYPHTGGRCSITGGYRYRGGKYQELYAKYFYADYCASNMHYLESNGTGGWTDTDLGILAGASGIVSFGVDKWGELYCSTGGSGNVFRFSSADCTPVAAINADADTVSDCGTGFANLNVPEGNGFSYSWTFQGNIIATDTAQIQAGSTGYYLVTVDNNGCVNTDSVYVNLVAPPVITINGFDTVYCVYHSPVTLSANMPGGVFSGNGIINSTFYPAGAGLGLHTITYTVSDSTGCTYTHLHTVRIDACAGISENIWLNTISLYPNPNSGNFKMSFYADKQRNFTAEISDVTGRIVYTRSIVAGTGEGTAYFSPDLSRGIYFLTLSEGSESRTQRLVIE
jgi:glucose/arabinose dehydrogenase